MKKSNKKGFTIVELVIVIAVIAILAAVLIPTFSGVVEKANQSKALQEATNTYKSLLVEEKVDNITINGNLDLNPAADGVDLYIVVGETDKVVYQVVDGKISKSDVAATSIPSSETATVNNAYYKALTATGYTNVYVFDGVKASS